jgi:hypothetical protein
MNKNVLGPYSQKVNHNKSQSPLNWRGCRGGSGGGGGGIVIDRFIRTHGLACSDQHG